MSEKELREKIAKKACVLKTGKRLSKHGLNMIQFWDFASQILILIKQANYVRLADLQGLKKEMWDILKRWFPDESYGYTEAVGEICNLLNKLSKG